MESERIVTDANTTFKIRGALSGTVKSTLSLFESVSIELEKKPAEIVLDLENTLYIDSMSIGLLIGLLLKGKEAGIRIRLDNVPASIMGILKSTNLNKLFADLY